MVTGVTKRVGQADQLDGIPQRSPSAMRLDAAHRRRVDTSSAQGRADHIALGDGAGHRVPVGPAGGVERAAPQDSMDVIPVSQCPPQRFEHDRAHALCRDVTVTTGTEGAAASVGGEEPRLRQGHILRRVGHDVDTTDDRGLALTRRQAPARQVEGCQG